MKYKWNYSVIIFFLFSCCMCFLNSGVYAGLPEGQKLPSFTLKSIDNTEISLEDFKGKVVVLHLWKCQ